MWINEELFFKVVKEHPDWFPNWVLEGARGNRIWNKVTGEIIYEDGTMMHDLVYRGKRDYDNYWKDCFNDKPCAINGGPETYKVTLSYDDYVKDPESLWIKAQEVNNQASINL